MVVKIEPTEKPGYYRLTFASGGQVIAISASSRFAYFNDAVK